MSTRCISNRKHAMICLTGLKAPTTLALRIQRLGIPGSFRRGEATGNSDVSNFADITEVENVLS